jgi:hypothetical protein
MMGFARYVLLGRIVGRTLRPVLPVRRIRSLTLVLPRVSRVVLTRHPTRYVSIYASWMYLTQHLAWCE